MAGLLAWAADVVGGHGSNSNQDDDFTNIPLIFSPEQQQYVQELDRKASSLTRLIQDLRLRLPPPDISQRLPHLHAHSLASNAALALQLNAHSSTREQAQLREETLQQENTAYENAIPDCDGKIHEKVQEADMLRSKLKEMDEIEKNLRAELEDAETNFHASHSRKLADSVVESTMSAEDESNAEASKKSAILDKLEKKKNELISMEETVKDLENKWESIQSKASKQLSPAQREKALDKQLHSLIEQLAAKQAQAEGLIGEIHSKEKELERLSGLWTKLESSNAEATAARNRFGRGSSDRGSSSDFSVDYNAKLPYYTGGRSENQQRLMLLRSAFVLYILALHILVFIRISF
ncbi:hypothetical protein ERO13_D11G174600v2 [Gossypium hirsutum]|uniref:Spindle pole body component 110 n=1 Tax=Gossypium hirsutum TaxID=3635 RepID=A0A1U8K2J9_GOSHI|nr:spindle pole body component 110 [Gossypium hirsutum]KAG4120941.1 hypothetical protein ERO13_D11G174600v2 [Gossypium hirsutum]